MDIVSLTFYVVEIVLLIFEIIILYFLAWHFFHKKESFLKSGFFQLLFCQSFVNCWYLIAGLASSTFGNDPNLMNWIGNVIKWYAQISTGGYSSIIAGNRCTAVAYPTFHETIWTKRNTIFVVIGLFLYPVILQSAINPDFYCLVFIDIPECLPTRIINGTIFMYSNSICTIAAINFFFFGMWKIRNTKLDSIRKIEKRLLLQSLLETILLIAMTLVAYAPPIHTKLSYYFGPLFVQIWIYTTYFLQHFLPLILIFYSSSIFRKHFFYFYFGKVKALNISSVASNQVRIIPR